MKEVGAGGGSHPPPKGSLLNFPASAIHAPTLGQQSYFPTQPPLAFLFPIACPGALASRPRGPAVPSAPSLETSGEGPGQLQSTHPHSLWNHLWGSGPRLHLGLLPIHPLGPHSPGASGSLPDCAVLALHVWGEFYP